MSAPLAVTAHSLSQSLTQFPPPIVVDVRLAESFARDPQMIPGAIRRTPDALDAFAREMEPWRAVVVYCVHGHDVGRDAAAALAARGVDASYLAGGLEAWRADGGATAPRGAADAVGDARATEDRPHRVPVAHSPLHRSDGRILLCAVGRRARVRARSRCRALRRARRALHARRRTLQLRRVHCALRAARRGARAARDGRASCRYRYAGRGRAGSGTARNVARPARMFADDLGMLRYGMLVYDALYVWCKSAAAE